MMPDEQPETSKYTIHIEHAEGIAIGDGAQVIGGWKGRLPIGVPFQAPPLPAHFVPRPEVSNALKARLFANEPSAPGSLVISAVHGLGGIGKTTLVASLAHDHDLQTRLLDGILWATLGHEPDVLSLLVGWIQELHDYDFRPTVVESASSHLRTLLHDKACLLVVDDAWQADHVRPFLVGGERCQVLVTTRDATLARKVGARLYDLDVMTEPQALALFQARLGPLGSNRKQAAVLARELGYLPLALELAAAQVEAGITWEELLDVFRRELADLAALDLDEATYRNESLRISFRLSLERLPLEDQEAFAWLGILPEDVRLDSAVAAALWDQSEADARRRLRLMRDKALVRAVAEEQYTMHDLLHSEAKLRLVEKIPLPEAHAILLAHYQAYTQSGLWHTLPDNGYIHEHLTWHMEQARHVEAIHALLQEETPEGRNGWYEARERLGHVAGYLADVSRAWRLADSAYPASGLSVAVGLQCRYALIFASFTSLAWNIPPPVLAALVENGLWTPAQGLAYARQSPEARQRGEAIVALTPYLPPRLKAEALPAVGAIDDERIRVKFWIELAPHLTADLQEEIFRAVRSIEVESLRGRAFADLLPHLVGSFKESVLQAVLLISNEPARADALARLIPNLPAGLLDQALSIARDLKDEDTRILMFAGLVPRLEEPCASKVAVEAFESLASVASDWVRAKTLAELAPNLPVEFMEQALHLAQEVKIEGARTRALMGLAPYVPAELAEEVLKSAWTIRDSARRARAIAVVSPRLQSQSKAEALAEALDSARAISIEETRAITLADLANYLSADLKDRSLRESLTAVQAIKDEQTRARALQGLSPAWAVALPQETLAGARSIENESIRAEALIHLDPLLLTTRSGEALLVAKAITDRGSRVRALVGLIPHLPETLQAQTAKEALAGLQLVDHEEIRANELVNLGPHLPAGLKAEAFDRAAEIEKKGMRARALAGLASHLPPDLLQKAFVLLHSIGDHSAQGEARIGLTGYLPASLQQEALNAAHMIEDDLVRAQALIDSLPRLVPDLRNSALEQALSAMPSIRDEFMQGMLLGNLAPCLSSADTAGEALLVVHAMKNEGARLAAIQSIAPHLVYFSREELLAVAKMITTGSLRAKAMAALLPHLPEKDDVIRDAQATIQTTTDPLARAEALADLVAYLPEQIVADFLRQVLPEVHSLGHAAAQAKALTALAALGGRETESIVGDALKAARLIDEDWARVVALAGLLPHLPVDSKATVLKEAIETAQTIETESAGVSARLSLVPYLTSEELRDALTRTLAMESFVSKARSLKELVPSLPTELRDTVMGEVLTAVQSIEDEWLRAETLAELAPYIPIGLLPDAMSVARAITDGWSRTIALKAMAQQLAMLPTETLYPLWQKTLHALAHHARQNLLRDLGVLAPVVASLGDQEATTETYYSVQAVGRWWP
ncbi:MAG: hypothetical protein JXM73_21420 [Anaerolineae bacterium]|nr:hypothetical protein [Anaerolineae bacterium]